MTRESAMVSGQPFDDIRALLETMPEADTAARTALSDMFEALSGPFHPLGHSQEALIWLAGWQARQVPAIERPLVAIFAGSRHLPDILVKELSGRANGADDISVHAQERVDLVTEGQAGVRGIAAALQAAFKVYEMGLEYPVDDFTLSPSLSERDCAAAIAFGMEVVAEGADIIALGNTGLGSATAAAAIARGLYGGTADYWTSGLDHKSEARTQIVEEGANLHKDILNDPLEVLRCFGGRDIAGMVGAILAARHQSIPVVLDGFVSCAAAAILHELNPHAIDHCWAGHRSSEPAHGALLERLNLTPILDLGIGVGDGSGASLGLVHLRAIASGYGTLSGETRI